MKRLFFLLPLLLVLCPVAKGQSAGARINPIVNSIPVHGSWKIDLLNEAQWKYLKANRSDCLSEAACTDVERHLTFIREKFAMSADQSLLEHAIWHEAGHISCGCLEEKLADRFAAVHSH
jgi:hypothetical protein